MSEHGGIRFVPCDTMDPLDTWTGIDHDSPIEGCDVGCLPCPDATVGGSQWDWIGASSFAPGSPSDEPGFGGVGGSRWLRPLADKFHRDAYGFIRPMQAGTLAFFRRLWKGERSPCYDNSGVECFGKDTCFCHPFPDPFEDCSPPFTYTKMFPDLFWYEDYRFPVSVPFEMDCRLLFEIENIPTDLSSGTPYYQTLLGRFDVCTHNAFAACISAVRHGDCYDGGFTAEYYNDGSAFRNVFSRIYIGEITAFLDESRNQYHTDESRSILAVKNAALKWLDEDRKLGFNGWAHFDQADHVNFFSPSGAIGFYQRGYSPFFQGLETPAEIDEVPSFLALKGKLRSTGHLVFGELFVVEARIGIHIMPNKLTTRGSVSGAAETVVFPIIWSYIDLTIGIRAAYRDGETPIEDRNWIGDSIALEIVNPDPINPKRLPFIKNNYDQIVWELDGKPFDLEQYVLWRGYMGPANNTWNNVWFPGDVEVCPRTTGFQCCSVASGMSPTTFEGRPSWFDKKGDPQVEYYKGGVTFEFRDDGACGDCWDASRSREQQ